jgi:hypothetical protein
MTNTIETIPTLRGQSIPTSEMLEAGRLIAARLGRSPRAEEYKSEREIVQREAADRGELLLLPSYASIHRIYPTWDAFLVAAGLQPLGGSRTGTPSHGGGRTMTCTKEVCVAAINMARHELGDPISGTNYTEWRAAKIENDPTLAYTLPSLGSIYRRFPSWNAAVLAAIEADRGRTSR